MEINECLKKIICEITNNSALFDEITDKTDIINDIGLDSLQMINLLLRIEEEFEIELDYETIDINKFKSFGLLLELVSA